MSQENDQAGGQPNQQSSGSAGDNQEAQGKEGDKVAYETYRKVLAEKKKRDLELAETRKKLEDREASDKTREEKELAERQEYKKLLEIREGELKQTKEKLGSLEAQTRNAHKLESFLSNLDGKVDRKFWGHIDIEAIAYDPETGEVDKMSVAKVVEDFKKEFPELIKKSDGKVMPQTAPKTGFTGEQKPMTMKDKIRIAANRIAAK